MGTEEEIVVKTETHRITNLGSKDVLLGIDGKPNVQLEPGAAIEVETVVILRYVSAS